MVVYVFNGDSDSAEPYRNKLLCFVVTMNDTKPTQTSSRCMDTRKLSLLKWQ